MPNVIWSSAEFFDPTRSARAECSALAGEGEDPGIVAAAFGSPLKKERLVTFTGETGQEQAAAGQWLLK
jgi:hypothetical protein